MEQQIEQLIDQPKQFRIMPDDIRSNWLYQKYAVHQFADNIEHCINPTKQIWLDALEQTPRVAEFIPNELMNDNDIIAALLQHDDCQRYTRYVTFTPEQLFGPKWYSNDHAVISNISVLNTPEIINHICTSRLPSQRNELIQELCREHIPAMEDKYAYMPHIFYSK